MLKKIIWSDKYSVGVSELDEQHKQFFKICNSLLNLVNNKSLKNDEVLLKIMRLGDYASYHLGAEEDLFIETKYPDTLSHKKIHDQFRKQVTIYINEVRNKEVITKEIVEKFINFTSKWFLNHILVTDKKYSKWFNDHGIK